MVQTRFECLLLEEDQGIATVRLNRPKVLNAMNRQMWLDLQGAIGTIRDETRIRAMIITGEGRAFSSGADLRESKERDIVQYREYLELLQAVSLQLIRLPKPTIAAVNGYALGSGYELALACDIRIAAESARFGFPEAGVSSSVTGGTLRLLQALVGAGKARELLFTGDHVDGKEAERIGLVNRTVPDAELMKEAVATARKVAAASPISIGLIKRGLNIAWEASLEALMDYEVEACLATVSAPEREWALRAFEERKKEGR